jgi:predicted transcriptional regulator of viral defense system
VTGARPTAPSYDALFSFAAAQDGHFTTQQAAEAGYSRPLLAKYLKNGRVIRVQPHVYRLVHFPGGEHEHLTAIWLRFAAVGVFSHDTALALHELSDVLPARVHLTLPFAWRKRRLRVPDNVMVYHADVKENERQWHGAVPVTTPLRTIIDVAAVHIEPDLLRQATTEALHRGLFALTDLPPTLRPTVKDDHDDTSLRHPPRLQDST